MQYLVERSNTGFSGVASKTTIIGIYNSDDIENSDIGSILAEKEKNFQPENSVITYVDMEPVFHHDRNKRNGPIYFELNFKIGNKTDLIKFKNLITLYRITKINNIS